MGQVTIKLRVPPSGRGMSHGHGQNRAADGSGDNGWDLPRFHSGNLHRVDKPAAVGKLTRSAGNGMVKLWEILRWYGEIGIEDHEDVSLGHGVSHTDGVTFSLAGLLTDLDPEVGVLVLHLFNGFPSIVSRVALNENQLCPCAHERSPGNRSRDITSFIPGGNDD